ncbi:MAG: hypothetical protein GF388_08735 [Candidatus Aegiribacteria sp.]|nr:hypothetical protein [Candidatus Aegiribacteria sp.]MBD3295162.1 hypothetical protein [Candidatus Fermentibacteria bacterium]
MRKGLFALLILFSASFAVDLSGTVSRGGFSGFPNLPGGEILHRDRFRLQTGLEYIEGRGSSRDLFLLPLNCTYGLGDNLELGGEVPLYLDDGSEDGQLLGDMTVGCGWLYETARGGSMLVLHGFLRLPTGSEGRDRGTELGAGLSTSTTFRLFRLQAAVFYVLGGGYHPFENRIVDRGEFSAGGSSYITRNFRIAAGMDGSTAGELGLSCTGMYYMMERFCLLGTARIGLDGAESYSVSLGVSWTGGS